MELEGPCRTAGCREQHRHPVTGALPDYHWVRDNGVPLPRWIRKSWRKPGSDPKEWYYRTDEVARACGVAVETVRVWIRSGRLRAGAPPGQRRPLFVKGCDLEAFVRSRGEAYPMPSIKE